MENTKPVNPYIVAIAVLLPAFLSLAASSATNVSQPHIAGFYGATQYEANTVITCYIIAGGLMIPITSYLIKIMGKYKLMVYSIWAFALGCLLCIISPNLQFLIGARIFQGVGSGCILPLSQAILLEVFPKEKHGIAMGLFGIAAMFSPLAGPYIGGILTDNWSWHWIFIMNIPLCVISYILVRMFVEKDVANPKDSEKKFDIIGYMGIVVAMSTMQIILDKGQQFNWFDETWICWMTGLCVFSFIFFYVWELEYKNPVIDIRVFKDKNFLIGTFISSFINVMLYSTLLLIPMFVQRHLGYSPSMSGLTMLPRAIVCLIGLLLAGALSRRIPLKILAGCGLFIMGTSVLMLTQMNSTSSIESIILPNLLLCLGIPIAFVPITTLSFATLDVERAADGASLHALFKNIVTAIATAMSATFIARVSQVHQTYLVKDLSVFNPNFLVHFTALKTKFLTYYPSIVATKKANGMLYHQLQIQSSLASFFDAFAILALLSFAIIPFLVLLKIRCDK